MLPPPCLDRIEDFSKRKVSGQIALSLNFKEGMLLSFDLAVKEHQDVDQKEEWTSEVSAKIVRDRHKMKDSA